MLRVEGLRVVDRGIVGAVEVERDEEGVPAHLPHVRHVVGQPQPPLQVGVLLERGACQVDVGAQQVQARQ